MYRLLQHWVAGILHISENSFGVHLFKKSASVLKKSTFQKAWPPWLSQRELPQLVHWNTHPLRVDYLLHHLKSRPVVPKGGPHPRCCRNQVCAPYCHDCFHLCKIWRDSSAFPQQALSLGLLQEWHSISFFSVAGLRHKYFWQTAWTCEIANASVRDSLCMCLGSMVGPAIFVLRAQMFTGEKHRRWFPCGWANFL